MVDLVRPLKFEHPSTGGTQTDEVASDLNETEDYVSARGFALQRTSVQDEAVLVDRDASDNMTLKDAANPTPRTLTEVIAGVGGVTDDSHKTLLQLIHFLDEGPSKGFATGATKTVTGGLFPTLIEWKRQDGTLLVSKTIARSGGGATNLKPTPITWRVYNVNGIDVLETVSDVVVYTGVSESSRVRAIS